MRTRLLVALLAVIVTAGVLVLKLKTNINWDKLQSIEVYTDSTVGENFEKMSDMDLSGKEHYKLDIEQAKPILKRAKTEVQLLTIWKSYKYAVAHFSEGKPLRMKISDYGGFFLILNYGRKYQVRESDIEAWEKLWATY
ncbi:MAG TPA: hypothetical protein VK166_00590 [Chitinophagaceae bacterium]|nr:hypothetical protein [Chitinophagaceae bacterium]